jgi:hypothetical protein
MRFDFPARRTVNRVQMNRAGESRRRGQRPMTPVVKSPAAGALNDLLRRSARQKSVVVHVDLLFIIRVVLLRSGSHDLPLAFLSLKVCPTCANFD